MNDDDWNDPKASKVLNDLLFSLQPIRNGVHIPAMKVLTKALREARAEGMECAAKIADDEALSEFGWATKYMATGDATAMHLSQGGHAAAQDIARAIRDAALSGEDSKA